MFGRTVSAAPLPHREVVEAFEDALDRSGLPLVRDARRGGRPRLTFGAPLPIGMIVDREPFDLWLTELRPVGEVRMAVVHALAPGYALHEIFDVWLGAAALPACVKGAEYHVILEPGLAADELERGVSSLLAARILPRRRTKGGGTVEYDLRPLVAGLELRAEDPPVLRIEVRFDPVRGSGRPEEVAAALGEVLEQPLSVSQTRRVRLILEDDAG